MPHILSLPDELVLQIKRLHYPDKNGYPSFDDFACTILDAAVRELLDFAPIEMDGVQLQVIADPSMPADEAKLVNEDGSVVRVLKFRDDGNCEDETGKAYQLSAEDTKGLHLVPRD